MSTQELLAPPLSPTSPSWISFSPDPPHTPIPASPPPISKTPAAVTPRSYSRPVPSSTYVASLTSTLPKLEAPPARREVVYVDSTVDFAPKTSAKNPFAHEYEAEEIEDTEVLQDSAEELARRQRAAFEDRFSIFLSATALAPIPQSPSIASETSESESNNNHSSSNDHDLSSPPTSNSSSPTSDVDPQKSSRSVPTADESEDEIDILISETPRRRPSYPFALPEWCAGKEFSPGISEAVDEGSKWIEESEEGVNVAGDTEVLGSTTTLGLETPGAENSPPHTPIHPYYYASRYGSSTKGRRRSSVSIASRRPSVISMSGRKTSKDGTSPTTAISASSPKYGVRFEPHVSKPILSRSPSFHQYAIVQPSSKIPPLPFHPSSTTLASKKSATRRRKRHHHERTKIQPTRANPEGYNLEALDQFFGIKPDHGKAIRNGYGNVPEPKGGWATAPDFKKLLDDDDSSGDDEGSSVGSNGKKKRPPPLDLSGSSYNSLQARRSPIARPTSAQTIDSPYVFSPDPITKEIRRRASDAAIPSESRGLKPKLSKKRSVVGLLKGIWKSASGTGGLDKVKGKARAGAGDFFE